MVSIVALMRATSKAVKRGKLPAENMLLSRKDFDKYVKLRSMGYCVLCDEPAVDAHHILERKLFPDGGYYLGNGAAVCDRHHLLCETTYISIEAVRLAAKIGEPVLPPGFDPTLRYDKWGNIVVSDDIIIAGPLAKDPGCQRALAAAQKAWKVYDKMPYMVDKAYVSKA